MDAEMRSAAAAVATTSPLQMIDSRAAARTDGRTDDRNSSSPWLLLLLLSLAIGTGCLGNSFDAKPTLKSPT